MVIPPLAPNDDMTLLFTAVIESTEEAVNNSLFIAATVRGYHGKKVPALPVPEVIDICR